MTTFLILLLVFWIGTAAGFFFHAWLVYRRSDFSGTIYVNKDKLLEKTVYSLVLDEYPEKLQFKKVVIFKVDASEENLDRE
jgi:hypothetical protein